MVKLQLPKLAMRVRFPLLAPKGKDTEGCPFLLEKITGARDRFKLRQKEPVFEKLVQLDQLAAGEVWVQIPVITYRSPDYPTFSPNLPSHPPACDIQ